MDSTGDHAEQAAAKAIELAEELATGDGLGQSVRAAQHLTYMAGLLRGGAIHRGSAELAVAVPVSDEEASAPRIRFEDEVMAAYERGDC